MITTIGLVNIRHITWLHFLLMMKTFKIYSFSNFNICTMLLTVVSVLYVTSSELVYLITGNGHLLTSDSEVTPSCPTLCNPMDTRLLRPWDFLGKSTFTHFPQPLPPPLATTTIFCF